MEQNPPHADRLRARAGHQLQGCRVVPLLEEQGLARLFLELPQDHVEMG